MTSFVDLEERTDACASLPLSAPALPAARGVSLARAADDLWRVLDHTGRVIGHLQAVAHPLGLRYRARRFHAPTARFRDLGDFWSPDDAVACLR
ncbi:MAG: hypothetical protein QM611_05740 [Microbacterium sp.]|uniref:hypothetical protein n=1 Tax=Microbacterium sp. TaxID=51671 RepID=UPI0039E359AC